MLNHYRIIDANINRISEGLRVLEDIARFSTNSNDIIKSLKELRHNIRKNLPDSTKFISSRNTLTDDGFINSQNSELDKKFTHSDLINANFKRAQEGLRVVEEIFNTKGDYKLSKRYEKYRFDSYELEKKYVLIFSKSNSLSNIQSDIYCLTDENLSNGRNNIEVVKEMIDAGIKVIQYREKEKYSIDKYNECMEIRRLTSDNDVTFIVNDDVALALSVSSDGIHIGQKDLPVNEVRKIVGDNFIIGLSTHSPDQAKNAVASGVDYIGAGPVFHTNTKKDVCDPVGLKYINYVKENINIPFVAIGGIKENNIKEVYENGASTFALVSEIVGAENISQKIKDIRKIIT